MNIRRLMLIAAIPVLTLLLAVGGVVYVSDSHADGDKAGDHVMARALSTSGQILSLERIAEAARRIQPGRLIDIDLDFESGPATWVYEVELLDDQGRVWELKLDARNGDLLKIEQDD
ncbi:MAG: PepSY domain-containing protein [Methyloversatilis sp.]|jgi:uncharacterized membrane protein YkoI|nr:PepSY domain-containing protein [Methyloversatilis sp.]MBP6192783.1 PepSY domain-containing protein [Methyloversatilis sp.]MBP9117680.1 PepSY domain-containing protein [Methyloversatilis sp.]